MTPQKLGLLAVKLAINVRRDKFSRRFAVHFRVSHYL